MTRTIMTVDDSTSVRQMVAFTLKQAGYGIIEASDGQDALNRINECAVNMLITDLNMPNLGGIELICRVRSMERVLSFNELIVVHHAGEKADEKEGFPAGNMQEIRPRAGDGDSGRNVSATS